MTDKNLAKPESASSSPMTGGGTASCAVGASESVARELSIQIYPRGYDWWRGTRAQLIAEGVVPQDIEWPKGLSDNFFTAGRFRYWLRRERPEGHKGPRSSYMEVDNWACRRVSVDTPRDGFAAAILHEKRAALEQELWARTPAASLQRSRYWAALDDSDFQAFKAMVVPQPKKRGRPRKSSSVGR